MNGAPCVLLIRHKQANEKTCANLAALNNGNIACVQLPFSRIDILDTPQPKENFDAVLISSPVAANLLANDLGQRISRTLEVSCVGEYSASLVVKAGFKLPANVASDAKLLAQKLANGDSGKHFIYPCGQERSFDFVTALEESGIGCTLWEMYQNTLLRPPKNEIIAALAKSNVVFLFSKRTARHFFDVAGSEIDDSNLAKHQFVAISKNVADMVPRKYQANTYIAKDKTQSAMLAEIVDWL